MMHREEIAPPKDQVVHCVEGFLQATMERLAAQIIEIKVSLRFSHQEVACSEFWVHSTREQLYASHGNHWLLIYIITKYRQN